MLAAARNVRNSLLSCDLNVNSAKPLFGLRLQDDRPTFGRIWEVHLGLELESGQGSRPFDFDWAMVPEPLFQTEKRSRPRLNKRIPGRIVAILSRPKVTVDKQALSTGGYIRHPRSPIRNPDSARNEKRGN